MPRVNLYNILYSGGQSPQERIQARAEQELKQSIRSLVSDYNAQEEKLLREAAAEFPNDPYGFSLMLFNEYSQMADQLQDAIDVLGDDATSEMKKALEKFKMEANKYWMVVGSIDGITRARVKGDPQKEEYYAQRLGGFSVVYDALPTGEIMTMRIEPNANLPTDSKPTNMGIGVVQVDKDGKPVIGAMNADDEESRGVLRVYVRGIDPNITPQTRLGGFIMEWDGIKFNTIATGDQFKGGRLQKGKVSWDYGLQNIRRASFVTQLPGTVVKDSKNKYYYVNYDGSLAPLKSKSQLKWLGVDDSQVYPLSPWEEEELPSEDKMRDIIPDPLRELKEKYEREAEETLKSGPAPWQVTAGKWGQVLYEKLHLAPVESWFRRSLEQSRIRRETSEQIRQREAIWETFFPTSFRPKESTTPSMISPSSQWERSFPEVAQKAKGILEKLKP